MHLNTFRYLKNSLPALIFGLATALNLFNYFLIDGIIVCITLWGVSQTFNNGHFQEEFGLSLNIGNIFLFAFIFSAIASFLINSPMTSAQVDQVFAFRWIWGYFAFFYLGRQIKDSTELSLALGLAISISLIAIFVIHFHQSGTLFLFGNRLKGFYENPNHLSLTLGLIWAYMLGIFLMTKKKSLCLLIILGFAILICFAAIISTFSRTVILSTITICFICLMYTKSLRGLFILAFFTAIFAVAIKLNIFDLQERFAYSLNLSDTSSQGNRLIVWKVAWEIFLDHPLFGVGLHDSHRLYDAYYTKFGIEKSLIVGHAHNEFLEILSGSGIIGFILYAGSFMTAITYLHKRLKKKLSPSENAISLGCILMILTLMISSLTEAPFRLHECRNFMLILMGVSLGFLSRRKEV